MSSMGLSVQGKRCWLPLSVLVNTHTHTQSASVCVCANIVNCLDGCRRCRRRSRKTVEQKQFAQHEHKKKTRIRPVIINERIYERPCRHSQIFWCICHGRGVAVVITVIEFYAATADSSCCAALRGNFAILTQQKQQRFSG